MHGLIAGVAGKILVYAENSDGTPKTGDAANIVCKVIINGGSVADLTTNAATEIHGGYYTFPVSAAESLASYAHFIPKSSTSGVKVLVVPAIIPMGRTEAIGR